MKRWCSLRLLASALLFSTLLLPSEFVWAANDLSLTGSSTLVKIQIVNSCTLNNIASGSAVLGTLNFGSIYKLTALQDVTSSAGAGSLELRCTPGTTAKVTLGPGLYGSVNNRKMSSNAGATVAYQLYTSASRQTIWDNTVGLSVLFDNDLTKTIPIYGRIFTQVTPAAGQYNDLVVVTISY